MLSRKNFIEKGIFTIGIIANCNSIILCAQKLSKIFKESSVIKTNLSFVDTELINKMLQTIDNFAYNDSYTDISEKIFQKNRDLDTFIKLYYNKLSSNVKESQINKGKKSLTLKQYLELLKISDGIFTLVSYICLLLEETCFEYGLKFEITKVGQKKAEIIYNEIVQIINSLKYSSDLYNNNPDFSIVNQTIYIKDENFIGKVYYKNLSIDFLLNNFNSLDRYLKYGIFDKFGSLLVDFSQYNPFMLQSCIKSQRALFKMDFIQYKFIEIYQIHKRKISFGKESIDEKGLIIKGQKQLIKKVLLGYLFAEIILTKMKIITYKNISGIFTGKDRLLIEKELIGLKQVIKYIAGTTFFYNKLIFKQLVKKIAIKKGKKIVPVLIIDLNKMVTSIKVKSNKKYVYSNYLNRAKSERLIKLLDNYLQDIKNSQKKIMGY